MPGILSVIIPNHNYGHWIAGALDSVVANECEYTKQIVIVDDGSTDDSVFKMGNLFGFAPEEKEQWYSFDYNGVKTYLYCKGKATGPSAARNLAIKKVWDTTSIFAMLDADDIFLAGKLGLSVQKIDSDRSAIGAVYTDYYTLDVNTNKQGVALKEPYSRQRLCQECIVHSACVISKEALSAVGVYDEEMRTCEDYDLWMRLSEKFIIVHIPKMLMVVRTGTYNSTATVPNEVWQQNWRRIAEKTQARLSGK